MSPSSAGRTIAIGDIHGCSHALEAILEAISPTPQDVTIVLGDVIDTGRESKEVIELLLELQTRCTLICIQGNHEEMLLSALENPQLIDGWINCGGMATINSYKFCGGIEDIDPQHIEFLRTFRDYYETDSHILVHANYEPDLPLAEQPSHALRWSLLDDPDHPPHRSGKRVVVGHTEQRDGEILDLGCVVCIDTYCHFAGWLTALDLGTGETWQTSRWGALREPEEDTELLQKASVILRAPIVVD
ncbi:MAG: serine/threonine protein phosphatase [Planctomycetaceae bacterium]|nr:serine/threonine protein phosphatase [Planctomycetaceae bacterium]